MKLHKKFNITNFLNYLKSIFKKLVSYINCNKTCSKCGIEYKYYLSLRNSRYTNMSHYHCRVHKIDSQTNMCTDCRLYPECNINCLHRW